MPLCPPPLGRAEIVGRTPWNWEIVGSTPWNLEITGSTPWNLEIVGGTPWNLEAVWRIPLAFGDHRESSLGFSTLEAAALKTQKNPQTRNIKA